MKNKNQQSKKLEKILSICGLKEEDAREIVTNTLYNGDEDKEKKLNRLL